MKIWSIEDEARRLSERMAAVPNRAAFARQHKITGGGSMIYQHMQGIRPMSLAAASAYAAAFGVSLEEISPRLARDVSVAQKTSTVAASASDEIVIPQYETGGKMGRAGLVLRDQPGLIRSWRVTSEWARSQLPPHTGLNNLCIVTGFGPSMLPKYGPGDPLLLDSGVRSVKYDAVYFFSLGNEGLIKLIQRMPHDGKMRLRAKSFNPDYEPFWIDDSMEFNVFGVVLCAWKKELV